MNIKNLIKALAIIKEKEPNAYVDAFHDVVLLGDGSGEYTEQEKQELEELGFFWCKKYDCWSAYIY